MVALFLQPLLEHRDRDRFHISAFSIGAPDRRTAELRPMFDKWHDCLGIPDDALEKRIARIEEEEDLARVRPDLDGNAIMELLGIPPGPLVGQAWRHLKELRLDRGPLTREEAEAELLAWAREQGLR